MVPRKMLLWVKSKLEESNASRFWIDNWGRSSAKILKKEDRDSKAADNKNFGTMNKCRLL
jgi:hypothetical protein